MPELPEVETVVRTLRPFVVGRRIEEARFFTPLILAGKPEPQVDGMVVASATRYGKNILLQLDRGVLVIHLGMTGKLLANATPGKHTRAVFTLDQGSVIYDDIRMFGRIEFGLELPANVAALGPDPLETTAADFVAAVRARKTRIKSLLLNQNVFRGLGNIYVDEVLFRSGIHPLALAQRLKAERLLKLHAVIVEVLEASIAAGGSSISDYVDTAGRQGSFQDQHQVYGKESEPCIKCGKAITRIVVAQRGTHLCEYCQKR